MSPIFDHEKPRAYQEALRFAAWVGPVLEALAPRMAARDQLERASTRVVLNIAEGNGKRSHPDRCRFLNFARGSIVECAACLDVLVVKKKLEPAAAAEGKRILHGVVSMVAGMIARFSGEVHEGQAAYGLVENGREQENENDF